MASFQLQDIDKVGAARGRRRRPRRRTGRARQRRSAQPSLGARPTRRSTTATPPRSRSSAGVWKRLADLAALDARFRRIVDQRDEIKPRLEDLAFFLRGYRDGLDASPERLQAVEDRLAAIERAQAAVRAGARGRAGDAGERCEAELADARRQRRARARALPIGRTRHARTVPWRAGRALGASRAAAAADARARAGAAISPSSPWPSCRIDVRVQAFDDAGALDPARHRRRRVLFSRPIPARKSAPARAHRVRRRTVPLHARACGMLDDTATPPARRSSSMRSTPASAAPRRTRSAHGCRRWAAAIRCSASRTSRRSRPAPTRTSRSSKHVRTAAARTPRAHEAREAGPRERKWARMIAGAAVSTTGARVRPRVTHAWPSVG